MNGSGLTYLWLKWRAMGWLVLGRQAPAEAIFNEMLKRWPNDAYARASRSHVRAQAGRRDEAIADLQALVAMQPERSSAYWFNLAFLLEDAGRYAEAEPACEFRHQSRLFSFCKMQNETGQEKSGDIRGKGATEKGNQAMSRRKDKTGQEI